MKYRHITLSLALGLIALISLHGLHSFAYEHFHIRWISLIFLAGNWPAAYINTYIGLTSVIYLFVLRLNRSPLITQPRIFALPALSLCLGLYLCLWGLGESADNWLDYCRGIGAPLRAATADLAMSIGAALHAAHIGTFYALCGLAIILFSRNHEK